ncbi:zona pellucida sperm-binding protein 3-like [Seriola lalandi dorsalis]|uniref:zona pellucida sperm-binding protein 3-like n=1 Tax=Seriola lalandi dorsalis TaxID=1841481 RepID=UPI000C6F8479|nr:zona pellucida sperm-binding protein 3-like [Seriola lalandi dorsalis]XP_056228173.1 zona pellucida sperm-binding protein 3 isoform X2 [Seriola aureovittata]
MGFMHTGLLLLLFSSAYSYQFRSGAGSGLSVQDPELEWARMETVIDEDMKPGPALKTKLWRSGSGSGSSTPEAKKLPEYVNVLSSKYPKEAFKPEKGARPLPDWVKEMLLRPSTAAKPAAGGAAAGRGKLVEILCHVDRMYVRIRRQVFKTRDAYKNLKLGTCPVNQGTKDHYYLLYLLKTDCGFKRESKTDYLSIGNVLHYKPAGVILREMPFDVSLQCNFPRWFHSYKVGFHPKLQGGTVFKALQPKSNLILTAQDASGNEITGPKTYTLGQPMYFEAKQPDNTAHSGDQRLYINKCFMTANQDPNSSPKYTAIDNQGCMIDGKVTVQSKFLSGASKMAQKFSVGALIFKDMVSPSSSSQQLYMHCEISKGKLTPTPSSKACNYDPATKKWKELYGDDSVCTCCESTCPSAQPRASSNIVSSHSWKVDVSGRDGYVDVHPQMKSLDADTFSLEDSDMAEHSDFVNYWEHDY